MNVRWPFPSPSLDLQVDETAMREYVGYGDGISDGDGENHSRTYVGRQPIECFFLSDHIFRWYQLATGKRLKLIVTGDMTIAGSTKSMDLDISFTPTNEHYMSGVIDFTFDFNITPYSVLGCG